MIVITEMMHPSGLSLLPEGTLYEPDLFQQRDRLKSLMAKTTGLVVRNRTQVDEDLLAHAPQLKVVGRLGVGLDNIDTKALKDHHVELVVPYGANAVAVAEYVMAALLTATRRIPVLDQTVRAGKWDRTARQTQLSGKTLGIVGYGAIGQHLATRAEAFGMTIKVHDPYATIPQKWVGSPWPQFVEDLDFVSLHVPLTSETRNMLDRTVLSGLKPQAWVINTARGELIDEIALADALDAGEVGGAILDVRLSEPPPPGDRLLGRDNVWVTPHIAGLTEEAQQDISQTVAQGILDVLSVAQKKMG